MIVLKIGNFDATLHHGEWTCPSEAVLAAIRVLSNAIVIGGHVPNADEYVIKELSKVLRIDVVNADVASEDDAANEVY